MPNAAYYKTPHWLKLRAKAIKLAGGRCQVPGCPTPYHRVTADHIKTRPRDAAGPTPFDVLSNLRVVCGHHDAQTKEGRNGKRFNGGKHTVVGCDASGMPLDPGHPWRLGR